MSLTTFHVAVSLVAIAAGLALALGLVGGRASGAVTAWFMGSTGVTLLTSFLFPITVMTPALAVAILCVAIFLPTTWALYGAPPTPLWRRVKLAGLLALFYFNAFVLVVQSFQKVPVLNAFAPLGNEPAVLVSQLVLLVAFLGLGFVVFRRAAGAAIQRPKAAV